jgi:lipoprotein-releasing system ATP-binding protein
MNNTGVGEAFSLAQPFLEVKNLNKWYFTSEHRVEVLRGLNLQVLKQDALAVVGSSGVGKSTLLHILGALDRPSGGEVLLEGQNIFSLEPRELAWFRNRKIGFVFQFHHLLPEFNALENTMMPILIAREPREKARARAENLLAQVGLAGRMTHRIGELSGGEQQRVAIARALVQDPELVLADEPTGNLDRKTGEQVLNLFMELKQQKGITFVMVTHNLGLAEQFNRKIEIRDGQAVELNHF